MAQVPCPWFGVAGLATMNLEHHGLGARVAVAGEGEPRPNITSNGP